MNNFNDQYNAFLNEFGKGRKMVLSTSLNDKVTSRMMSVIQQSGIFFFQTDKHFRKYDQLIKNERFAVTPLHMERWLYKDGIPFVESFDIAKREYYICEYNGEQN